MIFQKFAPSNFQVLAITEGAEGAHDVYRLAKDAAAQHSDLMSELNKVCSAFWF